MDTWKQWLFLMVSGNAWPWRYSQALWFHMCNYCQANNSCMTVDHHYPHGSLLHVVTWSCYNVSPNHTHKQDTISDMQCGCPLVWLMGDVVANVASVSFRGSGKLQIFPSQQEVQTWKKGREREWWAGRSWQEAGGDSNPAFKGEGWDFTGKQCSQNESPQLSIMGHRFSFWHPTIWLLQCYHLPRSQLLHLWSGDYNTYPASREKALSEYWGNC